MSVVRKLDTLEDMASLIASPQLTVVDAFATWCGPCKYIAPQIRDLAVAKPHVQFAKFDVDDCEDIAMKYRIQAMPTFLFFKASQLVGRVEGADIQGIQALLDKLAPARPVATTDESTAKTPAKAASPAKAAQTPKSAGKKQKTPAEQTASPKAVTPKAVKATPTAESSAATPTLKASKSATPQTVSKQSAAKAASPKSAGKKE